MIFNAVLSSSGGTEKEEQEKSVTITENGTTEITPDSGKTLSKVTITTNVTGGGGGGGESKLPQVVDKTVTEITAEDLQGATSIGVYAFWNCGALTSITIPDSVKSIETRAFSDCVSLTSIIIPNGVTSIGSLAFTNCTALTSITIPDSVTRIEEASFSKCGALTSITIPDSVTRIGGRALQIGTTSNKAAITFKRTTPPSIQSNTFDATKLYKIFVPAGTGETYKAATNWSKFASYIYESGESSGSSN